MRLFSLLIILVFASNIAHSQSSPLDTIDALFEAMRAGDGEAVLDLVAEGAPLMRVEAEGNVRDSSFEDWANWVDVQNEGDADEQIFAVQAHEHGDLASVWAPFILHYKGELVGCGVNQFTLARGKETWTIIHGIDTQDDGDCSTFKARYTANQ